MKNVLKVLIVVFVVGCSNSTVTIPTISEPIIEKEFVYDLIHLNHYEYH